MLEIKRGDIVLCDLNPVVGTEQSGIRPVVIIQINRANQVSPHTIILPCTTKIRTALLPFHVVLHESVGGLKQDSVVLCEQIRVIDKHRILSTLGHLDQVHLSEIENALTIILGISFRE